MTVPVNTTFRAHTTGGDHGKVFNFTGPRSRQWAKNKKSQRGITALLPQEATKEAAASDLSELGQRFWKQASPEDRESWDPWTMMSEMGYAPEDMTPSTGFGDAGAYQRLMPIMERLKGNPQALEAFIQANQLNQDYVKQYLEGSGTPENTSWWDNFGWSPSRDALDPANVQRGYNSAFGQARSRIHQQLVRQGVPTDQAFQQAQVAAQESVGSLEDFQKQLSSKVYNDPDAVGGMGPGSAAPWLWLGSAPAALAAKGVELGTSDSARALFGDEQAQQNLTGGMEGRLQHDALNNDFGYGLGDVAGGLASGLFGGQGSIDRGTAETAAGLEKLRTLGTAQNRINLENLRKRNEANRSIEKSQISGAPTLAQSYGLQQNLEDAKRRQLEGDTNVNASDRQAATEYQQATTAPYRNLLTGDPWMGEMSAVESAKSGRKWHPSEWGGVVQDWLTGGDHSHGYMMQGEDGYFDEPGAGRFQPYQNMMKRMESGKVDPRSFDVGSVPLASAGEEYSAYDPRRLMGWRSGARTGLDPTKAKDMFEKNWGGKMDSGAMSATDMDKFEKSMTGGQYGQDWRKATNFDAHKQKWQENRGRGDVGIAAYEAGFQKAGAARWAKTAGRDWYGNFEDRQTANQGYSLQQYRDYQTKMRRKMLRDLLHGRTTGSGMTRENEDYGQGLWERWNRSGKGRFTNNLYAPFGGMVSDRDIRTLDPTLSQHREDILAGSWRPGMQTAPLIQGSGFGWTNPLGKLSERLGFIGSPEAQKRQLGEGVVKSQQYQKLREDLRSGLLSGKDWDERIRGTGAEEYDTDIAEARSAGSHKRIGNTVSALGELINDTEKTHQANRAPYGVVQGY